MTMMTRRDKIRSIFDRFDANSNGGVSRDDLNPYHLDALYNLGCLFDDMGRCQEAIELYKRVVGIQPNHWRAQVNHYVLLRRGGKYWDAMKVIRQAARKSKSKVERDDAKEYAFSQLKKKKKNYSRGLGGFPEMNKGGGGVTILKALSSKFKKVRDHKTTRKDCIANAHHIRDFQWMTTFYLCDVSLLNKEMDIGSEEWSEEPEKPLRSKAALEVILRKLVPFINPEEFQIRVRKVNYQILSVLDSTNTGKVDLGMFYAVIAPICAGEAGNRKRAAFNALLWRSRRKKGQGVIRKVDALIYMKYLRFIYLKFPPPRCSDKLVVHLEEDENTMISFPEFLQIFDDDRRGFGILSTVVKLETNGLIRSKEHSCDACQYPKLKEMISHFSLCMTS